MVFTFHPRVRNGGGCIGPTGTNTPHHAQIPALGCEHSHPGSRTEAARQPRSGDSRAGPLVRRNSFSPSLSGEVRQNKFRSGRIHRMECPEVRSTPRPYIRSPVGRYRRWSRMWRLQTLRRRLPRAVRYPRWLSASLLSWSALGFGLTSTLSVSTT